MFDRKLLTAATLASCLAAAAPAAAKDIVIHAGRLIDGVSRVPRTKVSILIRDERIVSVTQGFVTPAGAEVVDLSQQTVLPGLIDCHVHLLLQLGSNPVATQVTRTQYDVVLLGVQNARSTLQAGFTSVRDVGGYTPAVIALKKAIAAGEVAGPRMWVSGSVLSPTGGHADFSTGYDPEITKPEWTDGIVDSPEAAIQKVRERHRSGADLIKIAASGGVYSVGDDPNAQLMTDAEIRAVVETAHTLHMKVAAHVHGKVASEHAVEIGVDSIEHGAFADETTYRVMKAHGAYLVPTIIAGESVVEYATAHPEKLRPGGAAKALAVGGVMSHNAGAAFKAGVKIAFGTDAGVFPHGENAREFRLMVDAGIPAMDAIVAATAGAADLIGAADDIGSIQPGRYADIIATRDDPLANIDALQHIGFVMQGGQVVKAFAP